MVTTVMTRQFLRNRFKLCILVILTLQSETTCWSLFRRSQKFQKGQKCHCSRYVDKKDLDENDRFKKLPMKYTLLPFDHFAFKSWLRSVFTASMFGIHVASSAFSLAVLQSYPLSASASDAAILGKNGLSKTRYWTIMNEGSAEEKKAANTALMDFAVGSINTMYYDNSAGARFDVHDFYLNWKKWWKQSGTQLESREGAVQGLRWLVAQLHDPYSAYLTREELLNELSQSNAGFLGLGAMVEAPSNVNFGSLPLPYALSLPIRQGQTSISPEAGGFKIVSNDCHVNNHNQILSTTNVLPLPVVTAIAPDSPAERAGLTVGDRIVAIGSDTFLLHSPDYIRNRLEQHYRAENYLGYSDLTIAKPIFSTITTSTMNSAINDDIDNDDLFRDVVVAYRATRVRLPTISTDDTVLPFYNEVGSPCVGGNAFVHYELLDRKSSIFDRIETGSSPFSSKDEYMTGNGSPVGYIRLTRFSRASTTGFIRALNTLESAGAMSYIIDLRNCYGGVIQEAMLSASMLLRDPHAILCYVMNSRGGFTPHDVEEYVVDMRYPGYMLSTESKDVVLVQVKREDPNILDDGKNSFIAPSSYASLHEHIARRKFYISSASISTIEHPTFQVSFKKLLSQNVNSKLRDLGSSSIYNLRSKLNQQFASQKKLVLLLNEGTASSAEVFASALHDNGRTIALIGSRTFAKGLIQHTFPMPDGGGLRLTVAEYLTPSLKHMTNVGLAQFDQMTGERVRGGIKPDIACQSNHGIPANVGADFCVGIALDVLNNADKMAWKVGGVEGNDFSREDHFEKKTEETVKHIYDHKAKNNF